MRPQLESLNIYRLTRDASEPPHDPDLVRLAEHFPQMMDVLEEVQALRRRVEELEDERDSWR